MRWSAFAAHEQVLAAVAHDQLVKPGVVLAGTTRRDRSARISGVEPLIMDGELWLSMMPASVKARDLYRDPRIQLRSIVTSPSPQAEIMMRGPCGPRLAMGTAALRRRGGSPRLAACPWRIRAVRRRHQRRHLHRA